MWSEPEKTVQFRTLCADGCPMALLVALDALPVPALACSADGRLAAVNAACARLFGAADPEALAGAAVAALFPDQPRLLDRLGAGDSAATRVHGRRLTGVPFT